MSGIRLIAQTRVKPGASEKFIEAWSKKHAAVALEAGCIQYEHFQCTSDPERFVLLEHWATREDFEAHLKHEFEIGPGAPGAADLSVEGSGELEMYDYQRFVFTAEGPRPASD